MRDGARLRAGATPPREAFADFAASIGRPRAARSSGSSTGSRRALPDPETDRSRPWVTPRSSRSAPRGRPGRGTGSAAARRARSQPGPGRRRRPRRRGSPRRAEPDARARGRREPDAEPPRSPAGRGPPSDDHPTTARPLGGIPAGDWLAAFQHGAPREVFGDDWEPQLARVPGLPAPPADRRLRRSTSTASTPRSPSGSCWPACGRSPQKWFRIEVRGVENIPAEGGALVVSNHSGTAARRRPDDDGRRSTTTPAASCARSAPTWSSGCRSSASWPARAARRWPATRTPSGCSRGGELVGVWPEGFKGIGKPFSERYKLQRFGRGGFVAAALRTGVPIVPLSVVGAEEIYPLVGNVPSLARLLGVPYVPITPFFPLLGPLGLVPLPSKWLIEFGEPIRTDEYDAGAADDPMLVFNVTDQVRETIQQTLYSLLMQRESVFGAEPRPSARQRRAGRVGSSAADAVDGAAERAGHLVADVARPASSEVASAVSVTVDAERPVCWPSVSPSVRCWTVCCTSSRGRRGRRAGGRSELSGSVTLAGGS